MNPEFLIPNYHVGLLHFPLALLLAGVACEVLCALFWRQSSARLAGRWMILLGAASGWPAAYSGLFAVRDIAGTDYQSTTWSETRAMSPALSDSALWEMLRNHVLLNAGASVVAMIVVIVWIMAGERMRRRLYLPGLMLLILTCVAVLAGAWHGGELVYFHDAASVSESPGVRPAAVHRDFSLAPTALLVPLDMHVVLAGFATSLSLLTWAVASRSRRVEALVPQSPIDPQTDRIHAAFQPATVEAVAAEPPRMTLGWFALAAVAAAGFFGWWSLSESFESRNPRVLLQAVIDEDGRVGLISRRLAHLIGAGVLAVMVVLVAWAGRKSCRSRTVPLIVGSLLLVAMIGQTWIGMLLLLDSNAGPVLRLNSEP